MAKIEIDREELKGILLEALTDIVREDSRTANKTSLELKDIEISTLKRRVATYKSMAAANKEMISKIDREYDGLNQEFEEAIRGDLMNLKLVKKYLDKVRPTAKTKDEYLKAMGIIDSYGSILDKFVEERWGHGEEE